MALETKSKKEGEPVIKKIDFSKIGAYNENPKKIEEELKRIDRWKCESAHSDTLIMASTNTSDEMPYRDYFENPINYLLI